MSKKRYYPSNTSHQTQSLALAAPVTGKKGRTAPEQLMTQSDSMSIDYFRFFESLYRREVQDWQSARQVRRDPFYPLTYHIQQLYKDAMLDLHLFGAINNRILRVINKQFTLRDADGGIDRDRSAYVQERWFKHIAKRALESKFYGYSTMLIDGAVQGAITSVKDIPRECVIPERGMILRNPSVPTGEHIAMADFPNFIIHAQLGDDSIGELERIAPLTIFKRHSWASWDEFEQIFGVPIRIARTMIDTKKHKDDLQSWLETMGTSAYGIFDKRVDLEIKENNRSDAHNVFAQKIQLINKEMSKAILGQTMTMDDGSSNSQANVHLQTLEEITASDIADLEEWVNSNVLPVMRMWGYDIPDGYYLDLVSNASIDPAEKIKIDGILMQNGYNLSAEYIEQTYEVVLDKDTPRTASSQALGFFG